uniref:Uncharacterized protein n=1 Tax=Anguilla anguilla TaxID=7936 RepID=A0A0E9TFR3_ANGAN
MNWYQWKLQCAPTFLSVLSPVVSSLRTVDTRAYATSFFKVAVADTVAPC